jgi:hypothetical protein
MFFFQFQLGLGVMVVGFQVFSQVKILFSKTFPDT